MNIYQNFFENMNDEEWEFFAIDFLAFKGFQILQSPSRGADGGLDGLVEYNGIKYLVSCKHFIVSNKSVGTSDENNIVDRMVQHNANGFIGFYSTLPSSSLITRFNSISTNTNYNYSIDYYDKDRVSDDLPNIPSNILQKYGLPNNIKYVMNVHESYYQPLKCMKCNIDILDNDRINISRVQISINEDEELEFFYGCKECLPYEEIGWLEINEALHLDRLNSWNNHVNEELKKYKASSTFFQDKNNFDTKIQQRIFPSNWGKYPISLIEC